MLWYKFFEIDLRLFDSEKAVIFFKSAIGEENIEVRWLKNVDLAAIQEILQATVDYYKMLVGTGERRSIINVSLILSIKAVSMFQKYK